MKVVKVMNMTSLFSREMLIYSFFDLRLKSPLRVIAIFYFLVLFFIIGLPVLYLTWPMNVYSMMFAIGVPFSGAILMSKPIWNGKSFYSFFKTQVRYFTRPNILYDWRPYPKNNVYKIDTTITVSRHDDFKELYQTVKQEGDKKHGKK